MISVISADDGGSCSEIDCKILALQMWKETKSVEKNAREYFTLMSNRQELSGDHMHHYTSFRVVRHTSLHIIQGTETCATTHYSGCRLESESNILSKSELKPWNIELGYK